jgi:hypothetical protein
LKREGRQRKRKNLNSGESETKREGSEGERERLHGKEEKRGQRSHEER